MKKLFSIFAVIALILTFSLPAKADWYIFEFSEEDLWYHTTSSPTRLYTQDAPRRHHIDWKQDVQTTDSEQADTTLYNNITGTNGWFQTDTYDDWLAGGPLDNSGKSFGITEVQLWGAGWPNGLLAWNERFRVNAGDGAWMILETPTGWTGFIEDNPWDDNGTSTLDQSWAVWRADEYAQRILFSSAGDGVDDYIFRFAVDINGEYPTTLEPTPDGDPFEADGSLRVWFGGIAPDGEGYDGIMELTPFNLGQCISTQINYECSGLKGKNRANCNKEQISLCHGLFNVPSKHNGP